MSGQVFMFDGDDPSEIRTEIFRDGGEKQGFFGRLFGGRQSASTTTAEFSEHRMCLAVLQKIESQLQEDGSIARSIDNAGWTLLQREALAGNFGVVRLLVRHGAEVSVRTAGGRTAGDLARGIGWSEIAS